MVLVVDFDGTYLKNDFFAEQFYKKLIENPFYLLGHWISGGSSLLALKHKLLAPLTLQYPVAQLVNEPVAGFINDNRGNYSKVVLVSASPDAFVKRMLDGDATFDSVHGSTDVNLKGENKLAFIREQFGDDFHYIGDSKADIPIFKSAKKGFRVRGNGVYEYR